MQELVYLLKVGSSQELRSQLAHRMMLTAEQPVEWVRVATMAPLSNYGYPPDAEGELLGFVDGGLVVGVEKDSTIPRDFVPWQNVAYISDGTSLGQKKGS